MRREFLSYARVVQREAWVSRAPIIALETDARFAVGDRDLTAEAEAGPGLVRIAQSLGCQLMPRWMEPALDESMSKNEVPRLVRQF